ncbi:MAG TPA: hypothetical protein VGC77_10085 [Rhodopseudomonas sp.]
MRPSTEVLRLLAIPLAMAAFLFAAAVSGGMTLRAAAPVQIAFAF